MEWDKVYKMYKRKPFSTKIFLLLAAKVVASYILFPKGKKETPIYSYIVSYLMRRSIPRCGLSVIHKKRHN